MEEQKNTNLDAKQEQNKKQKPETKKSSFSDKVQDYKAEFKKIIWPDRKSLTKETVAVVAASVLLGVIIAIVDFIARIGIEFLVK